MSDLELWLKLAEDGSFFFVSDKPGEIVAGGYRGPGAKEKFYRLLKRRGGK